MYINPSHSVMNATYTSRNPNPGERRAEQAGRVGEDVSISNAGRQVASAENLVPGAQASGAYPLEMYQVPSWQAEYMFEVPNKLGVGGDWFERQYPQAGTVSMEERAEYAALVQKHYQSVLDENGIHGVEEHYRAAILDKDFSESLRQQMSERVMSDARMMELMSKLGKSVIG